LQLQQPWEVCKIKNQYTVTPQEKINILAVYNVQQEHPPTTEASHIPLLAHTQSSQDISHFSFLAFQI